MYPRVSVCGCVPPEFQLVADKTKSTKDHGHKFEKQIEEAALVESFLSRQEGKPVPRAPSQVVLGNFIG